MEMYKKASQLKLRFNTEKGTLLTEQLWDLPLSVLAASIKAIKTILAKDDNEDDLSFLSETKQVDVVNQLRFDILKDVYLTKKADMDAAKKAADTKAHNQKILALIANKQEKSLEEKSIEELEAMLK